MSLEQNCRQQRRQQLHAVLPQSKLEGHSQHHSAFAHALEKDQKQKRSSLALRESRVIKLKGPQVLGP